MRQYLFAAFCAALMMVAFTNTANAQQRDCSECNALAGAAYRDCMATCVDTGSGGGGGGGGGANWCAKLDACKTKLAKIVPNCADGGLPWTLFTGEKKNCKAEAKLCKELSAEPVAKLTNELCAGGTCDMVACAYTGTDVPAESCPGGCPKWHKNLDGTCRPMTCEPICTEDALELIPEPVLTEVRLSAIEKNVAKTPFHEELWFWILVILGLLNAVIGFVLVRRTRRR